MNIYTDSINEINEYILKYGLSDDIDKMLNEYIKKNGKDKKIQSIEDKIIKSGILSNILDFAENIECANIEKLQEAILKSGDSDYCYFFARDVQNTNIKKFEEQVINSGNYWKCYLFARFIKGANKDRLQKEIIEHGDAETIFAFAKYIDGANIEKLQEAILKTGEDQYIRQFVKEIKGADQTLVVKQKTEKKNSDIANFVKKYAKNSIKLDVCKLKRYSKIGGNPIVPQNFKWPVDENNKEIPFFMQIDFSEINGHGKVLNFPNRGMLYLFLDEQVVNQNYPLIKGKHYQILFIDSDKNDFVELHSNSYKYHEIFLKSIVIKTYPNSEENDDLLKFINSLTEEAQDEYFENYHFINTKLGHVGGWPQIFQSSYLGKNETLLLQINSLIDEFMWGDDGMLQFYINVDDLKNKVFDNVMCNLETT